MKRKREKMLVIATVVALFTVTGGFVWYQIAFAHIDLGMGPKVVKSARTESWGQLRAGMTEDQVASLLSPAEVQKGDSGSTLPDNPSVRYYMVWEYGWTDGYMRPPSPKAYVIFFDRDHRVIAFRRPTVRN